MFLLVRWTGARREVNTRGLKGIGKAIGAKDHFGEGFTALRDTHHNYKYGVER